MPIRGSVNMLAMTGTVRLGPRVTTQAMTSKEQPRLQTPTRATVAK
ncbi:hypothetical protein HPC49_42440 [Pyxidicoccus fallax]|uniref:Uncharacterized protein n=1 Tax=Pyxidicoccus fallax TaxID=394095 RepID=A0A848LHX7_9BACT|nr:hypothetical protein [Pyxidicoccus fallax]NMO16658.1 hypothetical protein [Pyxidicoccus fallax]NPC84865.1 hypothetical protein [Pyxidicoccus fallax]